MITRLKPVVLVSRWQRHRLKKSKNLPKTSNKVIVLLVKVLLPGTSISKYVCVVSPSFREFPEYSKYPSLKYRNKNESKKVFL